MNISNASARFWPSCLKCWLCACCDVWQRQVRLRLGMNSTGSDGPSASYSWTKRTYSWTFTIILLWLVVCLLWGAFVFFSVCLIFQFVLFFCLSFFQFVLFFCLSVVIYHYLSLLYEQYLCLFSASYSLFLLTSLYEYHLRFLLNSLCLITVRSHFTVPL